MVAILLALGTRSVTAGPVNGTEALVCFLIALTCTSGVGWWAHCLERTRIRRERDEFAAATPLGGVH